MTGQRLAYTIPDAADLASVSPTTIRTAIHTTSPDSFPPPLKAKRVGRSYRILHADLADWLDRLPDA